MHLSALILHASMALSLLPFTLFSSSLAPSLTSSVHLLHTSLELLHPSSVFHCSLEPFLPCGLHCIPSSHSKPAPLLTFILHWYTYTGHVYHLILPLPFALLQVLPFSVLSAPSVLSARGAGLQLYKLGAGREPRRQQRRSGAPILPTSPAPLQPFSPTLTVPSTPPCFPGCMYIVHSPCLITTPFLPPILLPCTSFSCISLLLPCSAREDWSMEVGGVEGCGRN